MVKRIGVQELKSGMYVCGLEKAPGNPSFFMNNIKVNEEDIKRFRANGYLFIHIDVEEAHPRPVTAAPPAALARAAQEPGPREAAPTAAPPESTPEEIPRQEPLSGPDELMEAASIEETIEEVFEMEALAGEPETAPAAPSEIAPLGLFGLSEGQLSLEAETAPTVEDEQKSPTAPSSPSDDRSSISFGGADKGQEEEHGIKDRVEFREELKEAKKIRNEAVDLVKDFMNSIKNGEEIKSEQVHTTVGKMVDSIFSNQDALASLSRLKSFDSYTFTHSVNVCILSITIGRNMGLKKDSIHDLGVGAILHDVGKMLVPERILNKPGALTDEEFGVMKSHTTLGADLLQKTREITAESRFVALQHQEKYDGTGYPNRLAGEGIHIYGRISAVADVYDAMTSKRVYKPGMPPEEALKKMYHLRDKHFESEIVERLIKSLGIYPIGTLVELNTRELALVRMTNHTHPVQPVVLMLFDKENRPCPKPFEVDLKDDLGRWITGSRNMENMEAIVEGLVAC